MMPVPETPVHENRRAVPPHHNIRLARHRFHVEAIAVAVPPQPLPHQEFGFGAFAVDARHHIVALLWSEAVGHNVTK